VPQVWKNNTDLGTANVIKLGFLVLNNHIWDENRSLAASSHRIWDDDIITDGAMQITKSLRKWYVQLAYVLVLPIFFILFTLLYNPYGINEYLTTDKGSFTLNVLMLFCISIACLGLTRGIFQAIFHSTEARLSWFWYVVWCIGEMMVIAQFHTLYMALMRHASYLSTLDDALKFNYTILVFPYLIMILAYVISDMVNEKKKGQETDDALLRFHDENQKLKLVIASGAVLYLQSDENYVKINYLEAEKLKTYVLRNSMKSLEEMTSSKGMVRCHRSYIINPAHVTVLRKEQEGVILAELDVPGVQPIPVTKRYYDRLSELL